MVSDVTIGNISGTTRLAAVIGDPVRHSRSPAIHNAAYAAIGLDWVFVALEVPAGRGFDAVRAMPLLGIAGLSVTMPHKADAARACDALTSDAAALGVVNTVVLRPDGSLWGDSTDGEGFLRSLDDAGLDPGGKRVLVVGAGGAARAVVLALGRASARVTVAARRPDAAGAAAELAPGAAAVGLDELDVVAAQHDVIVNATPVGMQGEPLVLAPETIRPDHWVVDLVYHPAETPLLGAARSRGAHTVAGLGMLVHQAAIGFERMTGHEAPVEAMQGAARVSQ